MMGRCVLAIEHDWRIRKLIRANLEAVGLVVREAVSEQHGLQLLGEGRPDLILLDLELPGVDLPRLVHTLHAELDGQPVPIIVLSADPPARQLLHTDDVAGHLQKPFAASALLEYVCRALNGERCAR
jgi:two-component system KDP operon response regulator KdpE